MPIEDDASIKEILEQAETIAVVGASVKPWRDSNNIAQFLMREGYQVIPVNPKYEKVLGQKSYPDLLSIPGKIDIVDIFRRPDAVLPIVGQAIQVGAKTVWMQLGVINEEAARIAEEAELNVIVDHCIAIELRRLMHVKDH